MTNPCRSKKIPEPQQLDVSTKEKSIGWSPGRRKCKSGDFDDFLAMQQEYFEWHEKRDTQQAFMDKMKLLLQTAAKFGMTKDEYAIRERAIQAWYDWLQNLPSELPIRSAAMPLGDWNVAVQPPVHVAAQAIPHASSLELIVITSLSPAHPPVVAHPFGPPQAPTLTWNFGDEDDKLAPLPPPVFPNRYQYSFGNDEFAPPYA